MPQITLVRKYYDANLSDHVMLVGGFLRVVGFSFTIPELMELTGHVMLVVGFLRIDGFSLPSENWLSILNSLF